MDKRAEILEQTEAQVVELVLLVARKVVKVISENQKNVVLSEHRPGPAQAQDQERRRSSASTSPTCS